MKDPLGRTKVVVRHLPPSISESAVREQIDGRFSGRYKWFSFRPGKNCQKNQRYSRAYIDFESSEDVIEFAEFFDGHIFVNEKGAQLKALVEYAPSQSVPKVTFKKDGREGTIVKDPEYLEFLEHLAKPAENLPSAEIQLERKEAEKSGALKESPIVTPLMEFIRQKRAAKNGSQRSSASGKFGRRSGSVGSGNLGPSSKRGSDKRRVSSSMYVLRDSTKGSSGKDKSSYMLFPKKEEQKSPSANADVAEDGSASHSGTVPSASGSIEIGNRRVILLKGKDREATHATGGSLQHPISASVRNFSGSAPLKQSQRHEASGKIIRSILSNKDAHQGQPSLSDSSGQQIVNFERDKRPPRANPRNVVRDHTTVTRHASGSDDGKWSLDGDKVYVTDQHDKNERRTRNKDRPDRGVWAPLRRSDGTNAGDTKDLSSDGFPTSEQMGWGKDTKDETISHTARGLPSRGETKLDLPNSNRVIASKILAGGRANVSIENGSHRYVGRRGPAHGMKDVDGSTNFLEGRSSRRGGSVAYGPHEKQVWVQKSGSGP